MLGVSGGVGVGDDLAYVRFLRQSLRSSEDSKLLYLRILENQGVYGVRLRRLASMETVERFFVNVQPLVVWGLVHPHPLLLKRVPSKFEIRKYNGVVFRVVDESPRALLWALSPSFAEFPDVGLSDGEALVELRRLAREELGGGRRVVSLGGWVS